MLKNIDLLHIKPRQVPILGRIYNISILLGRLTLNINTFPAGAGDFCGTASRPALGLNEPRIH
jgi:hypothetical protein